MQTFPEADLLGATFGRAFGVGRDSTGRCVARRTASADSLWFVPGLDRNEGVTSAGSCPLANFASEGQEWDIAPPS